jgi:hypothetical protein
LIHRLSIVDLKTIFETVLSFGAVVYSQPVGVALIAARVDLGPPILPLNYRLNRSMGYGDWENIEISKAESLSFAVVHRSFVYYYLK